MKSEERDPVSGNEVPVGAFPEEVRDDVPAMLSEGEFVLPADVVRYIGLDKLMQMRDAAKAGLAAMDDEGQIGGEPVEDIPEEDMSEGVAKEPLEMAVGGFVAPEYLGKKPPAYLSQSERLFKPPEHSVMPKEGEAIYGDGAPPAAQAPSPTGDVVPTVGQGAPSYAMKKYKNAEGSVMYVPFINGEPQIDIPEGYVEISRAKDINTEAELIEKGKTESASVESAKAGTATVQDSGSSSSGNSEQPIQYTSESSRLSMMADALDDPELAKLSKELMWDELGRGLKEAGSLLMPGGVLRAIFGEDKEKAPVYSKAQQAAYDHVKATYGLDDSGANDMLSMLQSTSKGTKVTRNDMQTMMEELQAKVGAAGKVAGWSAEEIKAQTMRAALGLLNSPAAKQKGEGYDGIPLGEKLGKGMIEVPDELGFFGKLFRTDEQEKEYNTKRQEAIKKQQEQLISGTLEGKKALDEAKQAAKKGDVTAVNKLLQEGLISPSQANQVREDAQREKDRQVEAARIAEQNRKAAQRASQLKAEKAEADRIAAAARKAQSKSGGGGSVTTNVGGGWQNSSSGGYTASTTGGTTITYGAASSTGTNTASTISGGTGRSDGGYRWATGGLVAKRKKKKSKDSE